MIQARVCYSLSEQLHIPQGIADDNYKKKEGIILKTPGFNWHGSLIINFFHFPEHIPFFVNICRKLRTEAFP